MAESSLSLRVINLIYIIIVMVMLEVTLLLIDLVVLATEIVIISKDHLCAISEVMIIVASRANINV